MKLTLVVSENCRSCKRAESQLRQMALQNRNIKIIIINSNNFSNYSAIIVPALFVEDELFSYGDIDEGKLISKINKKMSNRD